MRWRTILDTNYSVSDTGKVRRDTSVTSAKAGRLIKQHKTRDGYMQVGLHVAGRSVTYRTHRLVYAAFNGPIPEGLVIDHLDGNPANNRLDNLEAVSTAENVRRGFQRPGRQPTGAKLTATHVVEIREARARGELLRTLSEEYSVSLEQISNIVRGKAWSHVGGPRTGVGTRGRPRRK